MLLSVLADDGITIENVKVYELNDSIVSRMNGESLTSSINNVTINGLEIEGKQVGSVEIPQTAFLAVLSLDDE